MDKHEKCFVMREQRRSFTFCLNRPGRGSGSVSPGQTSGPLSPWNNLKDLSVFAGRPGEGVCVCFDPTCFCSEGK